MKFTWLIGWFDVVKRVHEFVDTHVYRSLFVTCFWFEFGMFFTSGILVFTSGISSITWRFWSLTVNCIIHEFRCVSDSKYTIDFGAGNSFLVLKSCFWAAGISVMGLKFWCLVGVFGSNTVKCIIRYNGICMGVYVYLYACCRIAYLDQLMGCFVAPFWTVFGVVMVLKIESKKV